MVMGRGGEGKLEIGVRRLSMENIQLLTCFRVLRRTVTKRLLYSVVASISPMYVQPGKRITVVFLIRTQLPKDTIVPEQVVCLFSLYSP